MNFAVVAKSSRNWTASAITYHSSSNISDDLHYRKVVVASKPGLITRPLSRMFEGETHRTVTYCFLDPSKELLHWWNRIMYKLNCFVLIYFVCSVTLSITRKIQIPSISSPLCLIIGKEFFCPSEILDLLPLLAWCRTFWTDYLILKRLKHFCSQVAVDPLVDMHLLASRKAENCQLAWLIHHPELVDNHLFYGALIFTSAVQDHWETW